MPKPIVPVINWNNPITKGLVFDAPLFERGGTTSLDIVNKNTGTFNGSPSPSWAVDLLGPMLSFNGSTAFIKYPEISAYDLTTSAMSVEVWVKWPSSAGGQIIAKPHVIGSHTSPFFSYAIMQIVDQQSARFWITTSGNSGGVTTGQDKTNLVAGNIYQIVGTYDGSNIRIYQNAVLKDTVGATGTITSFATPLQLGANGQPGEFWNGITFIARVWKRSLNLQEIKQLYTNPWQIYNRNIKPSINTGV